MKFSKSTLPNGLRVITIPMPDNPAVTVLVMVEAGSKYETKEINGLSHFLEHVMFKGTTKRPKASDISKELDGLGAHYNAFTSQEFTGYYAKVDARSLDKALDIVSDMYQNPIFDEAEITKEKGVIIEEIKMYNDLPQEHVHDVLSSLMFPDVPAGFSVIGPEENIRRFTRDDFISYRDKHYVASGTIVVVSGPVDPKVIEEKVSSLFASIPIKEKGKKDKVVESQSKPQIAISFKETDQTHLVISLRTFSIFDKRNTVMKLLASVLGRGMSSRLFSRMRDQLGICYYIRASHNPATDHGDLSISAGVDNKRVDLAIENIIIELKRLTNELVPEDELRKVKNNIAGTTMLGLETSDSQAEYVAFQEILKRDIKLPEEKIAEIEKVTAEEVRELAREIFVDNKLNMAIIGPYKNADKERFEKILTFAILA